MKSIKFVIFLMVFFGQFLFGQKEVNLENNLTGTYLNSTQKNIGVTFTGANFFTRKHLTFGSVTNYIINFGTIINENEFVQRSSLDYRKKDWDCFISHQFNYSLTRKINQENWIGVGAGIKKEWNKFKITSSYAFMCQNSVNFSQETSIKFRHSLRLKPKLETKIVFIEGEWFYQPNIYDFDDYIILGTNKLVFFPDKKLNFLVIDVLNFRSLSSIKMIHNITIGISYKIKKVYNDKNPSN